MKNNSLLNRGSICHLFECFISCFDAFVSCAWGVVGMYKHHTPVVTRHHECRGSEGIGDKNKQALIQAQRRTKVEEIFQVNNGVKIILGDRVHG